MLGLLHILPICRPDLAISKCSPVCSSWLYTFRSRFWEQAKWSCDTDTGEGALGSHSNMSLFSLEKNRNKVRLNFLTQINQTKWIAQLY